MEIKVTVGVTPSLEKILEDLTTFLPKTTASIDSQKVAESIMPELPPVQQQQQQAVPTQQAPVQQQAPAQQQAPVTPTQPQAVPTQQAPVQQQAPTTPASQQQQPQAVPTSAPTYTFDQLAVAATQLMDAGRMADLQQLLSSFGVQALMELPETQFGAFATKLRELGAKI